MIRLVSPPVRRIVPVLVALVAAVGLAGPAISAPPPPVRCGAVITQSTTLTTDIGPCNAGGLVIGADNITLDLGGRRLTGKDNRDKDGIGIVLNGRSGVTVKNGQVAFFDAGILIAGGSGNTVDGVTATRNRGPITGELGDGIALSSSSGNTIKNSNVTYNGPYDGIGLFGSSSNNLLQNNFVGNSDVPATGNDGIRIEGPGAANNTVVGNTVVGSTLDGIAVFGTGGNVGNVIDGNLVTGNGFGHLGARPGDGIRLFARANNNVVRNNQVHDNAGNGIVLGRTVNAAGTVFSTENNQVQGNDTTGNVRVVVATPAYDANDQNPGCGSNTWTANTFGSAAQACIA